MALVSIKDMLNKARKEKYCVGAFDASYYGINTRSAGRYA